MYRQLLIIFCFVLFSIVTVVAQENGSTRPVGPTAGEPADHGSGDPDAKLVRGMSVLGNDEAPMSLFIVPWKASELGVEASLNRTLNERDVPVDREVFQRELDFYRVSVGGSSSPQAAVAQVLK